jgi:hypothetical protein
MALLEDKWDPCGVAISHLAPTRMELTKQYNTRDSRARQIYLYFSRFGA